MPRYKATNQLRKYAHKIQVKNEYSGNNGLYLN